MINKATVMGHLGRDPEVRTFANGGRVVALSVATSERWKDKATGEQQEKTEWHRVSIFNEPLGVIAEKYLKKGSRVYLEGQLETRKYQDQGGVEKFSTEIVLRFNATLKLIDRADEGDRRDVEPRQERAAPQSRSQGATPRRTALDDEIPFSPCRD